MSDSLTEAIELLKDVRNEFVQSVILQWKRGTNLSNKQAAHLILLAEQQKRSIERGYTGIDHGVTDKEWADVQAKLGISSKAVNTKESSSGYKKRYFIKELQPILNEIGGKLEKITSESVGYNGFKEQCYQLTLFSEDSLAGNETKQFRTLLDFVKYVTENNPDHPLLKLKPQK
jgi:hypothetical protein